MLFESFGKDSSDCNDCSGPNRVSLVSEGAILSILIGSAVKLYGANIVL